MMKLLFSRSQSVIVCERSDEVPGEVDFVLEHARRGERLISVHARRLSSAGAARSHQVDALRRRRVV